MCLFFFNKAILVEGSSVVYQAVVLSDWRGRTMVDRGDADYCVVGYNVFHLTDNFIAFCKWEIIMSLYDRFWESIHSISFRKIFILLLSNTFVFQPWTWIINQTTIFSSAARTSKVCHKGQFRKQIMSPFNSNNNNSMIY